MPSCGVRPSVDHLTIKDSTRFFVLLKLTTDRHDASRGLFATAELLVTILGDVTHPDNGMNPTHFAPKMSRFADETGRTLRGN